MLMRDDVVVLGVRCRKMILEEGAELKIRFGPNGQPSSTSLRIIELPDAGCLEAIKLGEPTVVRGGPDDDVVLTVGSGKTIRLRELCTSNTFWLVNIASGVIKCSTNNVIEAAGMKGNVHRLGELLRLYPYEGPQDRPEAQPGIDRLAIDTLPSLIQANDEELSRALRRHKALVIQGRWRIIGPAYICRFFELFFTTAMLEDWPVGTTGLLSCSVVIAKFLEDFFDEFPDSQVLQHIFDLFSDEISEDKDDWRISERLVCRFFADQLLRAKSQWASDEFMSAWGKLVGDFLPSLEMLRGLALLDQHMADDEGLFRLKHFPVEDLPPAAPDRLRFLFQTRGRWLYEDLLPFIEDLEEDEKALQALVIKHVRYSTDPATGKKLVTPMLPS